MMPFKKLGFLGRFLAVTLGVIFCWTTIVTAPSLAARSVTEVKISLGNSAGELKFFPSDLKFMAGQKYKLVLDNPSPTKHYFTAKDFADASWTQKVEAGKVEIKGAIHELELKPGAEAEWVLVPEKPGTYKLYCSIPGHAEAGMTGTIAIANNQ
ncbi:MAG: cupredoxin domain-containing protein [Hydrococcus sp. C42_A2020_068]|uniref:cupredoxin domain-containing protein n=1 Tax=Pleurocapsa sp. PCC 7327 TaxID=118163 RepID=UPI00029FFD72|nr:cupredoxin domain-containing protein [Pleurocapsa sp. PCC 7327]AFY75831.1 Copper binding protein, plastocyanin/azurin family [Pleurocapsa sp. PCC 7327]MBF2020392.1 cupredoxin domain-containing protein [Hydrococcus sp. C42_A2020_068]